MLQKKIDRCKALMEEGLYTRALIDSRILLAKNRDVNGAIDKLFKEAIGKCVGHYNTVRDELIQFVKETCSLDELDAALQLLKEFGDYSLLNSCRYRAEQSSAYLTG